MSISTFESMVCSTLPAASFFHRRRPSSTPLALANATGALNVSEAVAG